MPNIIRKHNKNLTSTARMLRKSMTPQEKKLWYDFLSSHSQRFLRQKVVDRFIADFYCSKAKLVIELDGNAHYTANGIVSDEERTNIIEQYGFKVLRFNNAQINNNFEGVCQQIDKGLSKRLPE